MVTICPTCLTPLSRILLETVTVAQLDKKFLAFYGTRRFVLAFIRTRYWTVLWARRLQTTPIGNERTVHAIPIQSWDRMWHKSVLSFTFRKLCSPLVAEITAPESYLFPAENRKGMFGSIFLSFLSAENQLNVCLNSFWRTHERAWNAMQVRDICAILNHCI
jgi:hypothetical protein